MLPLLRRKTAKSGSDLVERARALGVGLPDYTVRSAQTYVEITPDVRTAGDKIAQSVVENETAVASKANLATTSARTNGSGRSASDPLRIILNF